MIRKRLLEFFTFRRLLTRSWLPWVYDIGFLVLGLWAIFTLVFIFESDSSGLPLLLFILYVVALNVLWRLFCEALVMLVRIHDSLGLAPPPALIEDTAVRPEDAPGTDATFSVIPPAVSDAYDRWTNGDEAALGQFISELAASIEILPPRVDAAFLATRYRAAAGLPEFDALVERRSRVLAQGAGNA